jgi:hypothetical protein
LCVAQARRVRVVRSHVAQREKSVLVAGEARQGGAGDAMTYGITHTDSGCSAVWIAWGPWRLGFWYRLGAVPPAPRVERYIGGRIVARFWRFGVCRSWGKC